MLAQGTRQINESTAALSRAGPLKPRCTMALPWPSAPDIVAPIMSRSALLIILASFTACTPGVHQLIADGDLEALQARLEAQPEAIAAEDDLQKSPLHKAIVFDRADIFDYLIQQGADLNASDRTGMRPLHVAAALNRHEYARKLIETGAEIDPRDTYGDTPLHTAAMFGATNTIQLLIRAGADVFATNNENLTPAGLARKHRRHDLADQLEAFMERTQ